MTIPLATFLLAVTVSLAWSGVDLLRKLLVRAVSPVALVVLLTVGAVPLFVAWQTAAGWSAPGAGYWLPALASVAVNVLANVALVSAMRIAPLSVTVPLLSLTPAFAALLGFPLLGEIPTGQGAAGIAMVIVGAVLINRPPPASRPGSRHRQGELKGSLLVTGTALGWALTILLDKLALAKAPPGFHGLVLNAGVALGCLALLGLRGSLGELVSVRRVPGTFLLALLASVGALGLQLIVLPQIAVGTLETLKRGVGNLVALANGWWLLGETLTPLKLFAVALMTVGVVLVLR